MKNYMSDPFILAGQLSNLIFVDGRLQKSASSEIIPVISPYSFEQIGSIPLCNEADVNYAVQSAKKAQAAWSQEKPGRRTYILRKCGESITAHVQELAHLMSLETGKALKTESLVELNVVEDTFQYYAGLTLELKGETIPYDPNILAFTIREPLGVIGAIIPWNVPLMLLAMKVAPALAAGNTVVLKASPEASLTVLRAAELLSTILPKGVLNVITGDGILTGDALVRHPDIAKVTFTGSVESGRIVNRNAAEKIIPVTLELGGKSPFIIYPDADIDRAAQDVVTGMRFTRQGQSCSASSRVFVHETLHDDFIERVKQLLAKMVIGNPLDPNTDIGTLISQRQFDKVQSFLELAKADPSLQIHEVGHLPENTRGLFHLPTLISGITNDHVLCQQEIFGPVMCVLSWDNEQEVITQANATEYGLAAGVWTKDIAKALQAVKNLNAGFVQINQYMVFRPSLAFGGFKHSGLGKEASKNAMIEHFTKEKLVLVNFA